MQLLKQLLFSWGRRFLTSRWFESDKNRELRETKELITKVSAKVDKLYRGNDNWLDDLLFSIIPTYIEESVVEDIFDTLKSILLDEGSYSKINDYDLERLNASKLVNLREFIRRKGRVLDRGQGSLDLFCDFLTWMIDQLYSGIEVAKTSDIFIPLVDFKADFPKFLDHATQNLLSAEMTEQELYYRERKKLLPLVVSKNKICLPSESDCDDNLELIEKYFKDSKFLPFLLDTVPYTIPYEARSEHTHILGGSGHGKTELLKLLITDDLIDAVLNNRSVLVMDSQGDLLDSILRLGFFHPEWGSLRDRLIIIDPNEIEVPPALNLFALTTNDLDALSREKKIQSAVSLYAYLFGELLGAELTQRQGTLFAYLGRLMIQIPKATIHTLKDVLENGERYRVYMDALDGSSKDFFKTKFFDPSFRPVKTQIINRLWGILGTGTLDRMFSSPEMKVDLGNAFQSGKIILVNTAKELLKDEASAFFGKFILSLVSHAIVERASIKEKDRVPVSIYIDEAHEYLDDVMATLFNSARKYKVSLTIAHQNLDQLSTSLRSSIASSTSVKLCGGLSEKDARAVAGDMRTSTSFIQKMKKVGSMTEFALFIRNVLPHAVSAFIPLGRTKTRERLSDEDVEEVRSINRRLYGRQKQATIEQVHIPASKPLLAAPKVSREVSRPQGKGGSEHRQIQTLVKSLGEAAGYRAEIEKAVDGGFIDVLLRKENEVIAVEVSVTTDPSYELENLRKCLRLKPNKILIVSNDPIHLRAIQRKAEIEFEADELSIIHFISPNQLSGHLKQDSAQVPEPSEEITLKVVRGYRVKVKHSGETLLDDDRRRQVVGVVARG
jgi:hypothetical protein